MDRIRDPLEVEAPLLKRNNVKKVNNKTILTKLHLNRTRMVIKGFITLPKHTHLATPPWHDRTILTAQVAIQNRIRVILPAHAASHIINLCITWFLSSTNLFTVYSIRKRFCSDNPTVFNWKSFRHHFYIYLFFFVDPTSKVKYTLSVTFAGTIISKCLWVEIYTPIVKFLRTPNLSSHLQ